MAERVPVVRWFSRVRRLVGRWLGRDVPLADLPRPPWPDLADPDDWFAA